MTDRVLVPMDGASPSEQALEHALSAHPDAEIVVLHVIGFVDSEEEIGRLEGDRRDRYEQAEAEADRIFARAEELAGPTGVELSTDVAFGPPARAIPAYAEEHDIDHIVMGNHGQAGARQILLGSVAETVVRRAPVPVTVVRE